MNHTILSGAQTAEELVPEIQVWKKRGIKSIEILL